LIAIDHLDSSWALHATARVLQADRFRGANWALVLSFLESPSAAPFQPELRKRLRAFLTTKRSSVDRFRRKTRTTAASCGVNGPPRNLWAGLARAAWLPLARRSTESRFTEWATVSEQQSRLRLRFCFLDHSILRRLLGAESLATPYKQI